MDCQVEPVDIILPNGVQATTTTKKKKFYFQRDSLNRRNQLLVGKEGSRRRQRYDNGRFTFHPCAILYEEDLVPPGYQQTNKPFWSHHSTSLISHRIHQGLKKQHVPQGMVRHYEQLLVDFILECDDDDDGSLMVLDIDNPFARFVIHTMCRYYQMESYSKQHHGKSLLYVTHPPYLDNVKQHSTRGRSFFDYLYSGLS
ncbi:hypothetical protein BC941DRAFT_263796 [Chlamydoabsidia padenii]|nr:hypothetical protein BC941DRAFT_263796 [Chlamydoabsidia padenii]